ncbi:MAG: hypothetical protein GEU26_07340 [Nitrososphaeraceae archaeon]|nr:hypothetical protein [Nitrososphaeraceae archaeon]
MIVDIDALMFQVLSRSGIPGLILAGVAFGMRKTDFSQGYWSNHTAAMLFAVSTVGRINADFQIESIFIVPRLFPITGIGVMAIDVFLCIKNLRKERRKHRNFNNSL